MTLKFFNKPIKLKTKKNFSVYELLKPTLIKQQNLNQYDKGKMVKLSTHKYENPFFFNKELHNIKKNKL